MNDILKLQFDQLLRMLAAIVEDFEEEAWERSGHGTTRPRRLAYHIVQSIKYYADDRSDIAYANGKALPGTAAQVQDAELPGKADVPCMIAALRPALDTWLDELDPGAMNLKYPWTGRNLESVALFAIRHGYFHLGELNALLNEAMQGKAEDNFVKALG